MCGDCRNTCQLYGRIQTFTRRHGKWEISVSDAVLRDNSAFFLVTHCLDFYY